MNVLVTGASGLLGREVYRAFQNGEWLVRGTSFRRTTPGLIPCDLSRTETIPALLDSLSPDIVIHTAAERHPDISQRDPEGTFRLNVKATETLAKECAARHAFLVYLSTDYVFNGTHPPYSPSDTPDPVNAYGVSKRDGEKAVLEHAARNAVILRVPILYGPCETLGESAVTVLAENMKAAKGTLRMDDWATRYPTLTTDVANVLKQIVLRRRSHPGFSGIYHWSGGEAMTKYGMALRMAPLIDFDPARLLPDPLPPAGAPRPRDAKLDTSALESLGIGQRTPFSYALCQILRPGNPIFKSR